MLDPRTNTTNPGSNRRVTIIERTCEQIRLHPRVFAWSFVVSLSVGAAAAVQKPTVGQSWRNWGIFNRAPKASGAESHIYAPMAWSIEQGSRGVVVAVIDTGLDATHTALSPNVWKHTETGEYGFNFVDGVPNPKDDHGHGTHVAGIIGAVGDPSTGVSGVAKRVSIMAVKYYSDRNTGATNLANTIKALHYAIDRGAKVINYSGGGPEFSEDEYLALKKAEKRGVLVVAAAGNERQNTDSPSNYYYPAAYRLPNIVSVAATDISNKLLKSSNWGRKTVDLAAPGEDIYSTLPGGRFGKMTGTSQATAFVSGVAALLLAQDPTLTPPILREIMIRSVDRVAGLSDRLISGGKVNAYQSLITYKTQHKRLPAPGAPLIAGAPNGAGAPLGFFAN